MHTFVSQCWLVCMVRVCVCMWVCVYVCMWDYISATWDYHFPNTGESWRITGCFLVLSKNGSKTKNVWYLIYQVVMLHIAWKTHLQCFSDRQQCKGCILVFAFCCSAPQIFPNFFATPLFILGAFAERKRFGFGFRLKVSMLLHLIILI